MPYHECLVCGRVLTAEVGDLPPRCPTCLHQNHRAARMILTPLQLRVNAAAEEARRFRRAAA